MKTRLSTQILSFLVVGGLSTLIDFAIVYGLNGILGWHYQLAVLIAFVLATIFNYWASMRFTFESKFSPEQKHQEFLLFLILSLLGLALTAGLMWVEVEDHDNSCHRHLSWHDRPMHGIDCHPHESSCKS